MVSISGYVGKPETARKKGAHQFFFVNGRFMRHPYFHSAVMHAFDNLLPAGEHVSYFIYFSVDASSIDVNVHPTKTEIKFDNEQAIWQVLSAVVRESIGKYNDVKYLALGTGAFSMKYTIAYENDDYWIFILNEEYTVGGIGHDFTGLLGLKDKGLRTHYIKCDKDTFEHTEMREKDVFSLLKKK